MKNLGVSFLTNSILLTSAFYLFFVTIRDFFLIGYKNLSQNLAHFGFSLFILSILFNNIFSSEIITNLKIGDTFENKKFKINFESVVQKNEKNFQAIIGKFKVVDLNGAVEVLKPELRVYNQPNITTSEAAIKTSLFSDRFITMNLVQNQKYFNVRYQVKPLMFWIWLSVFLIICAGLIRLFQRDIYEN